jgi:hypothetical protein
MTSHLSSTPISITPSPSELQNGVLNQRNLEIAIRVLSRDGLVVLEDMIDHAILDHLNKKMVKEAYVLQARKDSPFNYNKGNIQQDPPMTKEWFSDEVFVSELVQPHSSAVCFPSHKLLKPPRPHHHPSHIHRTRSPSLPALHIRQHRPPSD